jgi:hypothetical protein
MRARFLVVLAVSVVAACGGKTDGPLDGGPQPTFTRIQAGGVDKVDVLFAIDNSASMGDKQQLLASAIPTLIGRLLAPDCVSGGTVVAPGDGHACATVPGTKPEFPPVHDLHVGIVSSSLGGGGSPDVCVPSGNDTNHVDDKGHLVARTFNGTVEGTLPNAQPLDGNGGEFLAWLPASDPKNAGKAPPNVTPYGDGQGAQLATDFSSLVAGVQQHGCGLEAQLESWYRFLVQPDPWDSIQMSNDNPPQAMLSGVDSTLLKMRHDFLRPDSLVLVVQLTDEEDSWSDPMWLGGYGWTARTQAFPGGPGQGAGPRGTSECDQPVDPNNPANTGPNNPDCSSCAFPSSMKPISGQPIGSDPNCNACPGGQSSCMQKGWYMPASSSVPIRAADGLNVRYGSQYMRSRYGFDSQHNVRRYIDGLTKQAVPDRDHEAHDAAQYATDVQRNCTNPLYAASLPDGSDTSPSAICSLAAGSRTPDLVYYAIIGGVPNALLDDGSGNLKLDLQSTDWVKILGKDPSTYQFDGIDPHMIESPAPRAGLVAPGTTYSLGTDPTNGREWNTLQAAAAIDLQFACTFDLPQPKDCTSAANAGACDCTGAAATAPDGPPLCSTTTRTTQIKGKAYPTIRELEVAKGLGAQSVVASICAKVVTGSSADATFGYNPAMRAIGDRVRAGLSGQCLPAPLPVQSDGTTTCSVLVEYPTQTNQAAGCADPGMAQPSTALLQSFRAAFVASAGPNAAVPVVCSLRELVPAIDYTGASCDGAPANGWCYVQGGSCPQSLAFGSGEPPPGTIAMLVCPP